jgi:catechol 2,3-dioxygenase-like lactoylglutathione lyase family enzyme
VTPLGTLKYLYVGVTDFEATLAYWRDVLGARLVWRFNAFDANVAAVEVGTGTPLVLLADHRPAPSVMPLWIVKDLDAAVTELTARGWTATAGPFGIPDGDCYTFVDPSGNECGFFEDERPDALVARYDEESKAASGPVTP